MAVGPHAKKSHKLAPLPIGVLLLLWVSCALQCQHIFLRLMVMSLGVTLGSSPVTTELLWLRQILIGVATSGRGFRPVQDRGR